MNAPTPHRRPGRAPRRGAVGANTVFGVALAIIFGLIFAWLFKTFLLDKKPQPVAAPVTVPLTVAATNVFDQYQIRPNHIKVIQVSQQEFDRLVKARPSPLLRGNQPVGRVAKVPIKAEEPIYEDMLEPYTYPPPVSEVLAPGKRGVVIQIDSKEAMARIGDQCDIHCLMPKGVLGNPDNRDAVLARNSKIVARNNTTLRANQPWTSGARTYTLEVSPYNYALIELAKSLGGKFALTTSARPEETATVSTEVAADPLNKNKSDSLVTQADLREVYGLVDPPPPPPAVPPRPPWGIERMVGLSHGGTMNFQGYEPRSMTAPFIGPKAGKTAATAGSGGGASALADDGAKPAAGKDARPK